MGEAFFVQDVLRRFTLLVLPYRDLTRIDDRYLKYLRRV
ncbi:MAG: hypothetical protein BSOLF_0082 [Candidatus Carbobacillus altaicus]|uniref:Uncharacterized protein n=1 Tax=Candidatus Carbonibacillus altaicus TaxID=2163959 RepID=A0A2R6Y1I6_9BACL|nr:MAG: hypothetical protein BSOLF_0082 [Candidatus Carbobacillus altaicus]